MTERIKALEDALAGALSAWDEHNERGHAMQGDWVHDARAAIAASRAAPDCQQPDLVTAEAQPVAWLITCNDDCGGCYGCKRDRYRIVDAKKYDASHDDYWVGQAAKNAHTVTPLYAAPHPLTVHDAARVSEIKALIEAANGWRRAIDAFDGSGSITPKIANLQSWRTALDAAIRAIAGGDA